MNFPAALPHDHPKQIADNLFVVHGCVQPNRIARFTRNMAIIREGSQLTLINPVRMDEAGLNSLDKLGEVKHILRLGPFHGMDDPFYMDRYQAEFWSFEGGTTYTTPKIDRVLSEDGPLPFSNAKLVALKYMREPEGIILLEGSPGILLTCDCIQSYANPPYTPHTNLFSKILMPLIGFPRKTLIGPFWMKLLVEDQIKIKAEFERVLALNFDQLLSAHGTFVPQDAHAEVQRAFEKMFR